MPEPLTLLVDNGSLEPAATLALRGLAGRLSDRLGRPVAPVSLLHSSGIDPQKLGGEPAEILFPSLERRLAAGQNDFILLPLFFGPSRALTEYLPENLARMRQKFPDLRLKLAPPLHAAGDDRLAQILAQHVRDELDPAGIDRVALVDHGSPVAVVTAVRNELAQQLAGLLGPRVAAVAPASMERRAGPEYDFCQPLLADLLATPPWNSGRVIVAMQFLLPGRHAGPAGDVAEICRTAEAATPGLRTVMTKLVAEHPLLIDLLADRWKTAS
ncbi:MAG TPA: cobalamin biosynthesis protein CbiX [Lacunisphaera sp.]